MTTCLSTRSFTNVLKIIRLYEYIYVYILNTKSWENSWLLITTDCTSMVSLF